MNKTILVAVALIAAWALYQNSSTFRASTEREELRENIELADFRCDGRQYCSQMTSRAEAEFFVRNCPDVKMDGDGDGVPCENDTRF